MMRYCDNCSSEYKYKGIDVEDVCPHCGFNNAHCAEEVEEFEEDEDEDEEEEIEEEDEDE